MFGYSGTVAELRNRSEVRAAARGLCSLYGAFEKAGLVSKPVKPDQKKRVPKPAGWAAAYESAAFLAQTE